MSFHSLPTNAVFALQVDVASGIPHVKFPHTTSTDSSMHMPLHREDEDTLTLSSNGSCSVNNPNIAGACCDVKWGKEKYGLYSTGVRYSFSTREGQRFHLVVVNGGTRLVLLNDGSMGLQRSDSDYVTVYTDWYRWR
ncbi:hypothetical protein PENSPDRAFT_665684 [Peniophora sp. CONT]|nr:hypothetical protein PENSPDRAFT_665684 [Peniophora sp. CONT]